MDWTRDPLHTNQSCIGYQHQTARFGKGKERKADSRKQIAEKRLRKEDCGKEIAEKRLGKYVARKQKDGSKRLRKNI